MYSVRLVAGADAGDKAKAKPGAAGWSGTYLTIFSNLETLETR